MKVWRIDFHILSQGKLGLSKRKLYPTERGFKNNLNYHKRDIDWFNKGRPSMSMTKALTAYDPEDKVVEVYDPKQIYKGE